MRFYLRRVVRFHIIIAPSLSFFASCSSPQEVVPVVLSRVNTPAEDELWKAASKPKFKAEIQQEKVTTKSQKTLAGEVTFSAIVSSRLGDFRVIPEQGGEVFVPVHTRYEQVDGFWWKGDRERWFKIPDHGEAWVVGPTGKVPEKNDGVSRKESFSVYWKSIPAFRWASAMKGGVKEPGWYPNAGKSRIGVAYPF